MTDTLAPGADAQSRQPARWSDRSFIEVQFPVSKLSKESYKERTAVQTQTLTGLGKWWGRKPLVLVRATILGLLLPATDDPTADREVFFALMTMDNDGLLLRRRASLSVPTVYGVLSPHERENALVTVNGKPRWKPGLKAADRAHFQRRAFLLEFGHPGADLPRLSCPFWVPSGDLVALTRPWSLTVLAAG